MAKIKIEVTAEQIAMYEHDRNLINEDDADSKRIFNPIRAAVRYHDELGLITNYEDTAVTPEFIVINAELKVPTPWRVRTKLKQWEQGKQITPFKFWIDTEPKAKVQEKPAAKTISVIITKEDSEDPYFLQTTVKDQFNPVATNLWNQNDDLIDTSINVNETRSCYSTRDKKPWFPTPPEAAEYLRKYRAGEKIEYPVTLVFPHPDALPEFPKKADTLKVTFEDLADAAGWPSWEVDSLNGIAVQLFNQHQSYLLTVGTETFTYGTQRGYKTLPTPKDASEFLRKMRSSCPGVKASIKFPVTFEFPAPEETREEAAQV